MLNHPKPELVIAAAARRLTGAMRSMDPTVNAMVEASNGKEDQAFKEEVERLLRECQTIFDPAELIRQAIARL